MYKAYFKNEKEEWEELGAIIEFKGELNSEPEIIKEAQYSFRFGADIDEKVYKKLLKPLKTRKDKLEEKLYNKRIFRKFIRNR